MAGAEKNAARRGQSLVFMEESSLSERPTVLYTREPRGHTPVVQYRSNWQQLSAIAGPAFYRFCFRFFPGTIHAPRVVESLKALRTQPRRRQLIIVRDGLGAH